MGRQHRETRFFPAVVECREHRQVFHALTVLLIAGLFFGFSGVMAYVAFFRAGPPNRSPSELGQVGTILLVLLGIVPGVVFALLGMIHLRPGPLGRVVINTSTGSLTIENVVVERHLRPRRVAACTFVPAQIRGATYASGFRGGPACLTIRTDRGCFSINEYWTGFRLACDAVEVLTKAPVRELKLTLRRYLLFVGLGLLISLVLGVIAIIIGFVTA